MKLSEFLDNAGNELLHHLNNADLNLRLGFEIINRLEEIARELRAAAMQIKRKEEAQPR